jgi:hypothetical protein
MKFNPIHPAIVDLYVNALSLHILQERLSKIGPKCLTKEIRDQVDKAASEYVISAKEAEKVCGGPANVQLQLDVFTEQRTGDA